MVEYRPIIAHLRSASGPDLTRFTLDFARYAGGDLLWIAYVPEGVRGWFGRFADTVDLMCSPKRPFQIVRLFGAPSSDDLKILLDCIEVRRAPAAEVAAPPGLALLPDVAKIADEIDRGRLHVTGLLLDVHHVPTLARQLRSRNVTSNETVRSRPNRQHLEGSAAHNLISILRRCRAANLHVLVATLESTVERSVEKSSSRDDAAVVLHAIDEVADLTLRVGRARSGAEHLRCFDVSVSRSRYPELPAKADVPIGNWEEILTAIRPQLTWSERLARAYPRDEISGLGELRESAASWSDPVQDEFARVAERRGWSVTRASGGEDRGEHWDVRIDRDGQSYRIDVKAQSKIRRRDPLPQDTCHWVELRGIVDDGWLFGSQADLIAFQTSNSFVLVRRADLAAHVLYHVDPDDRVTDPRRAEYRIYHRRDTGEPPRPRATGLDRGVLTLIPTERLRMLAREEWEGTPSP